MNRKAKQLAIKYRENGDSYSVICRKLRLSKSTLSGWVKDIPYTPNKETLLRIKNGPRKSAKMRHARKLSDIKKAKRLAIGELGKLSKRDLWLFGLGLYLGEGAKSIESVRLINSNPDVIRAGVKWLSEVCSLDKGNLTLSIHSYPDNDIADTINYWSRETGIPISQFGKTQIDKRNNKSEGSNRNKLPYGTVQLRVVAKGKKEFGVSLHRKIIGWIDAVVQQINKRD